MKVEHDGAYTALRLNNEEMRHLFRMAGNSLKEGDDPVAQQIVDLNINSGGRYLPHGWDVRTASQCKVRIEKPEKKLTIRELRAKGRNYRMILSFLGEKRLATSSEIADGTGIEKRSINKPLQKLLGYGAVVCIKQLDANGRKAKHWSLT